MHERSAAPARRRIWPWVVGIAALLLVVAAWLVTVRLYPPPEAGASFGAAEREILPHPAADDPEDGRTVSLLTYRHHETAEYMFSILNPGPLPITVTGVDLRPVEEGDAWLFRQLEARVGPPEEPFPERTDPFRPFRLAPEEERSIVIRIRFENCEEQWAIGEEEEAQGLEVDPGIVTQFWGTERIRYRILGLERSVDLVLPTDIGVDTPPREECPAPA